MTRRMSTSGTDHVPVLHNCGPTSASVYRTGCVGTQAIIEPRALVCALLALAGVPELPAVMFRPVQECQLHPALVAAAAGVTLDLAAKALNATSMVDDRELLARIVGGRRALGPSRAAYPALASCAGRTRTRRPWSSARQQQSICAPPRPSRCMA